MEDSSTDSDTNSVADTSSVTNASSVTDDTSIPTPSVEPVTAREDKSADLRDGVEPGVIGLLAHLDYLARDAAGRGLLNAVSDAAVSSVREDVRRLLSRPGTQSAPTPEQRQEIEARIDVLERITAVLGSESALRRFGQLVEEYLSAVAQAAPPQDEAADAAGVEAAESAAYVVMLAELASDIGAARDDAAPVRPGPPAGSMRAELAAVYRRASDAAAAAVAAGRTRTRPSALGQRPA
jgi:hypothetical protein